MKLLFVMESFGIGGVERVTLQLLKSILSMHPNVEVKIAFENSGGELFKDFNSSFYCLEIKGQRFLERFHYFSRIVGEYNPSCIVYTKGGLSKYKPIKPKLRDICSIAIQHVPINLPNSSLVKNVARQIGAALLFRRMDKVVCVSKGIEHNLKRRLLLDAGRLETIYNPVLSADIRTKSNISIEYSDYYVCVGRLHYQKGYDTLLSIFSSIVCKAPELKVVILGDGPDKLSLQERIAKLGLENNVILHGSTSNPYPYIAKAKAILLPSRWEGLPTVLVEASYLETQIISFDCRYGPRELTCNGKNGFLVPAENVTEFAKCILDVDSGSFKPLPNVDDFLLPSSTQNYIELFERLLCKNF